MAEPVFTPTPLKNQEFITSKICTQCGFIKPATGSSKATSTTTRIETQ